VFTADSVTHLLEQVVIDFYVKVTADGQTIGITLDVSSEESWLNAINQIIGCGGHRNRINSTHPGVVDIERGNLAKAPAANQLGINGDEKILKLPNKTILWAEW